jgi:hypothetical protein
MARRNSFLAAALVLLGGAIGRAGEITAAPLPVDPAPAVAAAPGCGCATCGDGGHAGSCWERLVDWLTYCPPHTPCHCGCKCGGCGHGCTPCCTPVYMYFLDRCSCTLGYKGPAICGLWCRPSGPPGGTNYSPPPSPSAGTAAATPYATSGATAR